MEPVSISRQPVTKSRSNSVHLSNLKPSPFLCVRAGSGLGAYAEGFLIYSAAVLAMQYKAVAMACNPNLIFWGLIVLSMAGQGYSQLFFEIANSNLIIFFKPLGYLFFVYVYGLSSSLDWYHTANIAFQSQEFWLAMLLVPLLLALSDLIITKGIRALAPSSQDLLLELYERDTKHQGGTIVSQIMIVLNII